MLSGFAGHLLSENFLEQHLTGGPPRPEVVELHSLLEQWRESQHMLGPASSLRSIVEAAAAPLVRLLGFALLSDLHVNGDVASATLRTETSLHLAPVALVVVRWGERLDPMWRRGLAEAVARGASWCVLFNGTHVRLIQGTRVYSRRFVEFDLDQMSDDERATEAFWTVLSAEAFSGKAVTPIGLLVDASERHAAAVCRSLCNGVLEASGEVLRVFAARTSADRVDAAFEQSLTVIYRILFLLFAEARALVPAWHPVYRSSYSIETLRAEALSGSPTGLWDALRAIARLAHRGCSAGTLNVTPFNGRLFAPAGTPLIDRSDLDDEAARRSLVALSTRLAPDGEGREPIAYRDLGVEQLGSVYETLLDYRPRVEPSRAHRTKPTVALVPGSGVRKATGTFYTPQSIATYLIRETLGPLVRDASPERILSLRIVDPAMGSGAFLVGACTYLGDAYETALVSRGACLPGDLGPRERASIRRTIAERCLYGVDLNPMAVQLARLSLWLATLAENRPLSFLDHHLQVGDSVLGAWLSCLRHAPVRRQKHAALPLFEGHDISDTVRDVLPVRFTLANTPNDTPDQVHAKERALAALARPDTTLSKWKRIADLWCARWFAAELEPSALFAALSDAILGETGALPRSTAHALLEISARTAESRRFFHWELEFPEVFFDDTGERRPDAGFDAVIGNPPWEMIRADAGPGDTIARSKEGARSVVRFTRDAGVYAAQSNGHANQYQLFVERSMALARPMGRIGLVLPWGLACDHGSAPLRRQLLSQCAIDSLIGFDNRRAIFPIHRSTRFLLLSSVKGPATTSIPCRLGETDPAILDKSDLEDSGHGRVASPRAFHTLRLTREMLETLSGNDLTIPDLRTPLDLAIVERAVSRFAAIGSHLGWHARFGRELNATEDRGAFRPGRGGCAVVEGKMLDPFRVRVDTARFRIEMREADRRLGTRHHRPRLAYRDVASATNRLTLIAAMLPARCVSTHTVFCLKTPLRQTAQWFLCGLFNSLVVNYLVRIWVTTHVTTSIVERLPIPGDDQAGRSFREIARWAQALSRRDDRALWSDLNARVAELYDLNEEQFAHILSSFPLVPRDDRDDAMRVFQSRTITPW